MTTLGRLRAFARRAFGPVARSGLSFRLILVETSLIALVVGGAFLVLSVEIRATTRRFFVTQLQRSQSEILNLQNRGLEQLMWTSSVITENPTLRARQSRPTASSPVRRGQVG